MAINLYDIDKKYIEFLQKSEEDKRGFTHVPNMEYNDKDQKFVCGAVLNCNGLNYYVPVSSNKTSRKSTILIEFKDDEYNKVKGSLNFAYMFPVPSCAVKRKNIADEKNMLKRKFLYRELMFIKSHKKEIYAKARNVYFQVEKNDCEKLKPVCCDFKLLETKCKEWEKEHSINKDKSEDISEQRLNKEREKEIIWGSQLAGAEDFAKDLEVAQVTARDIDGADIPNNTPDERVGVKGEVKKAKQIIENRQEEKKVERVVKKDVEI